MRIIFAGTPDFAVPTLNALAADGHDIIAVLTQPDRPRGRGRRLQASPVKTRAVELGLQVLQPPTLRSAESQAQLSELKPDLMVVVAYGLLLPQAVLDIPVHGCWNVHASLLPRWRGAAPIQRSIEAGDPITGCCVMQMDAGLDTGPVLARCEEPIGAMDTSGELHARLAETGARLLAKTVRALSADQAPRAEPQDHASATHAAKLSKAEARIDFTEPAALLQCRIRAFNPWPVVSAEVGGETLRIWLARTVAAPAGAVAGDLTLDDDGPIIACGQDALQLVEVQRPGGRRISGRDYANHLAQQRRSA